VTAASCAEIVALLGPYEDDDLPTEVRRRVEGHLLACRDCAWEAQTLRLTRERLREGIGEVVASDAFRARALARLHADNPHLAPAPAEPGAAEPEQYRLPLKI
jgi:hypothetical protein